MSGDAEIQIDMCIHSGAPPGTPHQGKAADTRPTGMLVGRQPCSCCGGHMTWACRQCGAVVYAPPIGPRLPCAARCCRGAVISNTEREFPSDKVYAGQQCGEDDREIPLGPVSLAFRYPILRDSFKQRFDRGAGEGLWEWSS